MNRSTPMSLVGTRSTFRCQASCQLLCRIRQRGSEGWHSVIIVSCASICIHWRCHVGRLESARPARQHQRSCRPQTPRHSSHSFRVHTLNAASLQEQPICLRAGHVAYDLVATQGGVTLMVELPTERWHCGGSTFRSVTFTVSGLATSLSYLP